MVLVARFSQFKARCNVYSYHSVARDMLTKECDF